MTASSDDGARARISAYFTILDKPDTVLFDAIQALVMLTDTDIEIIGRSRQTLASELLERFPPGGRGRNI